MSGLASNFCPHAATSKQVVIPDIALRISRKMIDMVGGENACIAGGFLRGLYMQQCLGLSPQINDIDIFADISIEHFDAVRKDLETEFGQPVRFHDGRFYPSVVGFENRRGLIEFQFPQDISEKCAGAKSIQLNFGASHYWANPNDYIVVANIGINQIAAFISGEVVMSDDFLKDMANKTMTMNSRRSWSLNDWDRTVRSMKNMIRERPEFAGWEPVILPKPAHPVTGAFWNTLAHSGMRP